MENSVKIWRKNMKKNVVVDGGGKLNPKITFMLVLDGKEGQREGIFTNTSIKQGPFPSPPLLLIVSYPCFFFLSFSIFTCFQNLVLRWRRDLDPLQVNIDYNISFEKKK